jgi:hypothetical protein
MRLVYNGLDTCHPTPEVLHDARLHRLFEHNSMSLQVSAGSRGPTANTSRLELSISPPSALSCSDQASVVLLRCEHAQWWGRTNICLKRAVPVQTRASVAR